jgi:hypothetical protein
VKHFYGNYVLGLGIILIPFFNFLSDTNLRLLTPTDITYIGLSLIPFTVAIGALSVFITTIGKNVLRISCSIWFLLVCVGFYLQFHYASAKEIFRNWLSVPLAHSIEWSIWPIFLALIGLLGLWALTVILSICFSRFINRALVIFTVLTLFLTVIPTIRYISETVSAVTVSSHGRNDADDTKHMKERELLKSYLNSEPSAVKRPYSNVYFIIVDGMMSLENASRLEIVEKQLELTKLNELGITYISDSKSSYNSTHVTLASIFNLDYVHRNIQSPDTTIKYLSYPEIMRMEANLANSGNTPLLLHALNRAGVQLVWQGNTIHSCIGFTRSLGVNNRWMCARDIPETRNTLSPALANFLIAIRPFYHPSMFGPLFSRMNLFKHDIVQHSLAKFTEKLDVVSAHQEAIFSFVHHLSPHDPHLRTETCAAIRQPFSSESDGYRASYRCVIREINEFLKTLKTLDPDSIVVIQGDHGWDRIAPPKSSTNELVNYQAEIFNAIKAPDDCFQLYGAPKSTVNSIRFALNCAYELKLPYVREIYYQMSGDRNIADSVVFIPYDLSDEK